jgi:hypothetical protein
MIIDVILVMEVFSILQGLKKASVEFCLFNVISDTFF